MTAPAELDEFNENDPDNELPLQHTWLARILRRLGADFPEYYWPAVWYLAAGDNITQPRQPESQGWELTLCITPTEWVVGIEFSSDMDRGYDYENWKDIFLRFGPFLLVLHRWWLHVQYR
jgi:hypothetical protein